MKNFHSCYLCEQYCMACIMHDFINNSKPKIKNINRQVV